MSETSTAPLVSVVMTVRNAEAYISETLASILQEQTVPLEVVLIDNGCTDSTIDRVRAFNDTRVRVIPGPKKGIAHALNVAYAAVRGTIIMRCDGDDIFPTQRITQQAKWLTEHPEFGAICGGFSTIDPKGAFVANLSCEKAAQEITDDLRNGKIWTHIGTFAIKTEVVKAAGCSREFFDCLEDVDFQLRVGETCRVWFTPDVMYHYRLHPSSVTHSKNPDQMAFYDSLAIEFQRQRQTRGADDLQLGHPPVIPDFGSNVHTVTEHVEKLLNARAWADHQAGRKKQAIAAGLRLVANQPMNLAAWRNLAALAIKPAGREAVSPSQSS